MIKYYCRVAGSNNWKNVDAISLGSAASKYVRDCPILSDFASVGTIEVFVKWDVDNTVYKFKIDSSYISSSMGIAAS